MSEPAAYPALDALVDAYHRRSNGRLVFRRGGAERSVVLAFRKVVFANSTEKKDRLELVLATRRLLRKEEVLRIAAKAKESGLDFMTMVQREGVLKDMALFDVMTERARDIIVDLLTWADCEVSQDPRGFTAEAVLPLNSDLLPMLVDGLMERFGADDCRRLLGSEEQVPKRHERPYMERELKRSGYAELIGTVLERIDGRRAIVDILHGVDHEGMAAMKILSVLRLLGAVELPSLRAEVHTTVLAAPPPIIVDPGAVAAPAGLSNEEKAALANIFEGATNLLEDDAGDDGALEILVDDDGPGEDTIEISESDANDTGPIVTASPEPAVVAGTSAPTPAEAPVADEEPLALEEPPAETAAAAAAAEDDIEDVLIGAEEPPPPVTPPQVQIDFNALLDIDPDEAARLFSAGLELFQKGSISSAIEVYRQAIDKDPSMPDYYSAIGLAYLESAPADLHGAQAAFLEAVKISPELPKNHYYLGKIYQARGEDEAAAKSYEDALARDASYTPAKQAIEALKGPTKAADDKGDAGGFLRKFFGR